MEEEYKKELDKKRKKLEGDLNKEKSTAEGLNSMNVKL